MLNENNTCKNCGADYSLHHVATNQCPEGGFEAMPGRKQRWAETTFEVVKHPRYAEAITKASDTIDFLLRELQDAHSNSPNMATEILLFGWLSQIVKIKTDVNRLAKETKGA